MALTGHRMSAHLGARDAASFIVSSGQHTSLMEILINNYFDHCIIISSLASLIGVWFLIIEYDFERCLNIKKQSYRIKYMRSYQHPNEPN